MAVIRVSVFEAVDFVNHDLRAKRVEASKEKVFEFDAASSTDIDVRGIDLLYDDSSSTIIGGSVSRIDLDFGAEKGDDNDCAISIDGINITATADLALIDDGAFFLFGALLEGNDVFYLGPLGKNEGLPPATSRIFGDDLENIISSVAGSVNTNRGGNDLFRGADSRLELSGDVWCLHNDGAVSPIAEYTGGDDYFHGVHSAEDYRIAGDAFTMASKSAHGLRLMGGDDVLDLSRNAGTGSDLAGDVRHMFAGTLIGGDDRLTSDASEASQTAGDVLTMADGRTFGGNDHITITAKGEAAGDVLTLTGGGKAAVFGGNDEIHAGPGGADISGDVLTRENSRSTIEGGDDLLLGGDGNDRIAGEVLHGDGTRNVTGGNDTIMGGAGDDTLSGQSGDDVIDGGAGNDVIDGGRGTDTASYESATSGVSVDLNLETQDTKGSGHDTLFKIEGLVGSAHDDTLTGHDDLARQVLDGAGGDDLLRTGAGLRTLLLGGEGEDTLEATGAEARLRGGAGNDTLLTKGDTAELDGGEGFDTLLINTTIALKVTIGTTSAYHIGDASYAFEGIEAVGGGSGDDEMTGGADADALSGREGDDTVTGLAGDDVLSGNTGDDDLRGNDGNDHLSGGHGEDTLHGGTGGDTLLGGADDDRLLGNEGDDLVLGANGDDVLQGGAGEDTLRGGIGEDTLRGGSGNDLLEGDEDADRLHGDDGADTLDGGRGADVLTGGEGADVFRFAPSRTEEDTITDFEDTGGIDDDRIDLSPFGLTEMAALDLSKDGDDAIISVRGNQTIRLVDYLDTHKLADLDTDDFVWLF